MPLPCQICSSTGLDADNGRSCFAEASNEHEQTFANEVGSCSSLDSNDDIRNVVEFRQLPADHTSLKNTPCMSLKANDLGNDALYEGHVLSDLVTSQHSARSGLDVDNGAHDESLAEGFGDLQVGFPDELSSGDGLELDESSAGTL